MQIFPASKRSWYECTIGWAGFQINPIPSLQSPQIISSTTEHTEHTEKGHLQVLQILTILFSLSCLRYIEDSFRTFASVRTMMY